MTAAALDRLTRCTGVTLEAEGLRRWSQHSRLWLLPAAWYDQLPAGYLFRDIIGNDVLFKPGETDNDTRNGLLAFGILVTTPVPRKPALAKRKRKL